MNSLQGSRWPSAWPLRCSYRSTNPFQTRIGLYSKRFFHDNPFGKTHWNQTTRMRSWAACTTAMPQQKVPFSFPIGPIALGGIALYSAANKEQDDPLSLHKAAEEADSKKVEEILGAGQYDLERKNDLDETPLFSAIRGRDSHIVRLLLSKGASPKAQGVFDGEALSPLEFAIQHDAKECFDVLVREGNLRVDALLPNGDNLVHFAVEKGKNTMLTHLLTQYCKSTKNLIEQRYTGLNPLHLACYKGNEEAFLLFMQKGKPEVNETDRNGRTVVHWAVEGKRWDMLKPLTYYDAELECRDANNKTPMDLLQGDGSPEAVKTKNILQECIVSQAKIKKNPPSFTVRLPENLVFEGGGPRGVAYLGALLELENPTDSAQKDTLKECIRIAGTSAGAITATLLAVGYSPQKLEGILKELDLLELIDNKPVAKAMAGDILGCVKEIATAAAKSFRFTRSLTQQLMDLFNYSAKQTGLCSGEKFRTMAEQWIQDKTGRKYCTFGELAELVAKDNQTYKHLYIFGTPNKIRGIKTEETVEIVPTCFTSEGCKGFWKDVIISDALRISMSIPGLYEPHDVYVKVNGERIRCDMPHFDGGLLNNYPLHTFDSNTYQRKGKEKEYGATTNLRTLGLRFIPQMEEVPLTGAKQVAWSIWQTMMNAEKVLSEEDKDRTISIDSGDVGTVSFNVSEEQKHALIAAGRKSVRNAFNKWETQKMKLYPGTESQKRSFPSSQPIDQEEAVQWLKKITGEADSSAMNALAEQLRCSEFALRLAAQYITHTPGCNIESYFTAFKEKSSLADTKKDIVNRVLDMSLERINKKNAGAFHWLQVCARFNFEKIPQSWLSSWLRYKEDKSEGRVLQEQTEIFDLLQNFSLVDMDKATETFSIPREVEQKILAETVEQKTIDQACDILRDYGSQLIGDMVQGHVYWDIFSRSQQWEEHLSSFLAKNGSSEKTEFLQKQLSVLRDPTENKEKLQSLIAQLYPKDANVVQATDKAINYFIINQNKDRLRTAKAGKLRSKKVEAYTNLGQCYFNLGDSGKAIDYWNKGLRFAKKDEEKNRLNQLLDLRKI